MIKRTVLTLLSAILCLGAGAQTTVLNEGMPQVTIFVPGLSEDVRLFVMSDTHLFSSDSREDPYRGYSGRMAKAYNHTKHFQTGEPTDPETEFIRSLQIAKDFGADAVLHLGDLISYPSEYAMEWAMDKLNASGIPWYYISGNHDWHYEGWPGTEKDIRDEFCKGRIAPLFQGHDYLGYSVEIKGVKIILVNDGINGILPSQVKFLKKELSGRQPKILCMHIPVAAPGRRPESWTIGSREWGWDVDKGYDIERRPRWPEEGHGQADYDFRDALLKAGAKGRLTAVVCGHIHVRSTDIQAGIPFMTVKDNASGGYLKLILRPQK